jgi:hypothetical protein
MALGARDDSRMILTVGKFDRRGFLSLCVELIAYGSLKVVIVVC